MDENDYRRKDFTEVAIGDFISGSELSVDIFIQLSEDKIIRVAHAGERVQVERFSSYGSEERDPSFDSV